MSVFPVPADGHTPGVFDVNVDGNHDPGTAEIDVYPVYITDTGHRATDTAVSHVTVHIPALGYAGATWIDTDADDLEERLSELPEHIREAFRNAVERAIWLDATKNA